MCFRRIDEKKHIFNYIEIVENTPYDYYGIKDKKMKIEKIGKLD